jgi:hypothetical protein
LVNRLFPLRTGGTSRYARNSEAARQAGAPQAGEGNAGGVTDLTAEREKGRLGRLEAGAPPGGEGMAGGGAKRMKNMGMKNRMDSGSIEPIDQRKNSWRWLCNN